MDPPRRHFDHVEVLEEDAAEHSDVDGEGEAREHRHARREADHEAVPADVGHWRHGNLRLVA